MKSKGGRPPKEIDLAKVEHLASIGLTRQQIADSMGIGCSTLYAHQADNPELQEAIKRGAAKGLEAVASKLYEAAVNGNLGAQCFYLKIRGGWRENNSVDVSHSGSVGVGMTGEVTNNIRISKVHAIEAEEITLKALQKRKAEREAAQADSANAA